MASDSILSREHHAAAGGIWPSPEGSDIRLPGGAASAAGGGGGGLDEQQAHKEGIHGSSFPKGLLEEEEWYDGSLIEEMKDLSYPSSLGPPAPPHSHSQSHHKPESFNQLDATTHFVGRSSNNSSSSAALSFHQERRSFSSFLDAPVPLDESSGMISTGFLSDFSAGLLSPHPPPPPPPVVLRNGFSGAANGHQQQQHHQLFNVSLGSSSQQQQQNGGMFSPHTGFLGDTLGNLGSSSMLDFNPGFGGFNSSNATGGGNFGNFSGIGSSLSIGMMPKNNNGGVVSVYGECFGGEGLSSSKEASFKGKNQQHTGSGQSSPSTIIKSPAFGSADSSLELGDDPATTSPKRKNQKEKKSPAASASAEDVAQANAASAVDLELREDDEMEDGSGLLCENDEAMGGHHKGPGGKGNRKGLPAKNLMAERRRRKKLNDRLYMLRSVVPKITKMDRASILGDAIEYLKELLQRINDLHTELEGPADAPMPLSPSPSLGGMQQPPPLAPAMIPQPYPPCVKEECGASAATPMIAGPQEMQPAKVDVRTRDGKTINIHMFCSKRPGLLLSTMRALDGLGLDVQQAVISCFNGFVLDVFRAEQFRDEIAAEEIKAVLLQTAACHDTIVPT